MESIEIGSRHHDLYAHVALCKRHVLTRRNACAHRHALGRADLLHGRSWFRCRRDVLHVADAADQCVRAEVGDAG
jgi:hypothetical protein